MTWFAKQADEEVWSTLTGETKHCISHMVLI